MIIKNIRQFGYFKRRPAPHRLEGLTTRQHPGMVLASFPAEYAITAPQRRVRDAARACGIKKGMAGSSVFIFCLWLASWAAQLRKKG